jgi:hypothetical protein
LLKSKHYLWLAASISSAAIIFLIFSQAHLWGRAQFLVGRAMDGIYSNLQSQRLLSCNRRDVVFAYHPLQNSWVALDQDPMVRTNLVYQTTLSGEKSRVMCENDAFKLNIFAPQTLFLLSRSFPSGISLELFRGAMEVSFNKTPIGIRTEIGDFFFSPISSGILLVSNVDGKIKMLLEAGEAKLDFLLSHSKKNLDDKVTIGTWAGVITSKSGKFTLGNNQGVILNELGAGEKIEVKAP